VAHELLWRKHEAVQRDSTIMESFAPEFSQYWLASQSSACPDRAGGDCEDALSPAQQEALEELAERVNAARSIY